MAGSFRPPLNHIRGGGEAKAGSPAYACVKLLTARYGVNIPLSNRHCAQVIGRLDESEKNYKKFYRVGFFL